MLEICIIAFSGKSGRVRVLAEWVSDYVIYSFNVTLNAWLIIFSLFASYMEGKLTHRKYSVMPNITWQFLAPPLFQRACK